MSISLVSPTTPDVCDKGRRRRTFTAADIWKAIPLGILDSGLAYLRAIEASGYIVEGGYDAEQILSSIVPDRRRTTVALANVSITDLGFGATADYRDVYDRAQRRGLRLCSPEVGPALRLNHRNQSLDEPLLMAMTPISNPAGGRLRRAIWELRYMSLASIPIEAGTYFCDEDRLMFVLPIQH